MSYYNQLDYGSTPYPHAAHPNATLRTAGCGVCCIAMTVEALTDQRFPPWEAALLSLSIGARVAGGTDMVRLGKAAAKQFGLVYGATNDISALMDHLENGVAIANVGGDRPGHKGLFSDGGHYVFVAGTEDGRLAVRDPGYYPGKYDKPGRAGKAEVRGNDVLVQPAALDEDCRNRWPRYYLFKEETVTQKEFDRMMSAWLSRREELSVSPWAAEEVAAAVRAGVTDGSRPRAFATREEVAAMVRRGQQQDRDRGGRSAGTGV